MAIISAIQMSSVDNIKDNLNIANHLIEKAADEGSKIAVLPEMFATLALPESDKANYKEHNGSGLIQDFLSSTAVKYKIWVVGGTIPIASSSDSRYRAACIIFNHNGQAVTRYDKINLFNANLANKDMYNESKFTEPGNDVTVIDSPVGKIGLAICYDIRFLQIFQRLSELKVEIIAIPAAFTYTTGKSHWLTLIKCRAIDTFSYIVSACQTGVHPNGKRTFGHSTIIDPWGTRLALRRNDVGIISADIDISKVYKTRRIFNFLKN